MRYLTILLAIFVISVTSANAEVNTPVNDEAALEWFRKNSQVVISKATVNPFELAGCLVFHKDGQVDQYLNVLTESIKKTLKPQNLIESVYRTMLTEESAARVGVLGMIGISTSQKSLLEVAINDRWKLEGPSFWGDNELKKVVFEVGKIYVSLGYKVSYNQNVQYSTLVARDFQENNGEVKSVFTYVDGNGKRFVQSSNYTQRELISIAPFDITDLLKAWNPKTIPISNFEISLHDKENLKGSYVEKGITLESVDSVTLKGFSKQITSKEFKEKLFK